MCGSSALWLYGGANGDLLYKDLMAHAVCSKSAAARAPVPVAGHWLTGASVGDTQILKGRSGSVSVGFPGGCGV